MIGEFTTAKGAEAKLVRKSLLVFAGVYFGAVILLAIVQSVFDFDMKMTDGIVSLLVASNMAGMSMVKRVQRMPEKEERVKLQLGCLAIVMAFQFGGAFLVAKVLSVAGDNTLMNLLGGLPLLMVVGGVLLFVLLDYFMIGVGIKSGAKSAFKALPETATP